MDEELEEEFEEEEIEVAAPPEDELDFVAPEPDDPEAEFAPDAAPLLSSSAPPGITRLCLMRPVRVLQTYFGAGEPAKPTRVEDAPTSITTGCRYKDELDMVDGDGVGFVVVERCSWFFLVCFAVLCLALLCFVDGRGVCV